jgi:hypothetical protein
MRFIIATLLALGICAPISAQRTHNTNTRESSRILPTEQLKDKVNSLREAMERRRKQSLTKNKVGDVWMTPGISSFWLKLKKEQEQKSSQCKSKGCSCACHKKPEAKKHETEKKSSSHRGNRRGSSRGHTEHKKPTKRTHRGSSQSSFGRTDAVVRQKKPHTIENLPS